MASSLAGCACPFVSPTVTQQSGPASSTPPATSAGDVASSNDIVGVALTLGAMTRVLHCMDACAGAAGVQEKACMALWSLLSPADFVSAVHPAGKAAAAKAGATARVAAARQRFAGHKDVVAAADGALSLLLTR